MSSASSDIQPKDRKKSAHWTEGDTEILVNVLLQHKDSGRTSDNGFKPEIWKEIADMLEGATISGGPKTPDACKSRWQRLQRDYKAAKEMEAVPGFSWDHSTHKLHASPADWDHAERAWEAGKFQRLHLPLYNSIALLCPDEKIRGTITRPRKSLGSMSDASSMLSLSVSSGGPPQTPQLPGMSNGNGHIMVNGHPGAMHGMPMPENTFGWDAQEMDAEGEYDGSFGIQEGGSHAYSMNQVHSHKRQHYDSSMVNGPSTTTAPLHMSTRSSVAKRQKSGQSTPQHSNGSGSRRSSGQHPNTMPYHITMPPVTGLPNTTGGPMRSPNEFTTHPGASAGHNAGGPLLDPALISPTAPMTMQMQQQQQPQMHSHQQQQQQPQHQAHHQQRQQHSHQQHQAPQQHLSIPHGTPQALQPQPPNIMPPSHHNSSSISGHPQQHQQPPTPHQQTPKQTSVDAMRNTPNTGVQQRAQMMPLSPAIDDNGERVVPDYDLAGLTEAQRRTQAVLQLQREADVKDEEMLEIMAEFETNIPAMDTYLALKKESLRRGYLSKIVTRRQQEQAQSR